MIDQRALPGAERYVTCTDYREVIAAINDLTIRGAPAIGVAAAMGIALGALRIDGDTPESFRIAFEEICRQFAATRPTARNLFWAIERMKRRYESLFVSLPPPLTSANIRQIANNAEPASSFSGGGQSSWTIVGRSVSSDPDHDPWHLLRESLATEAIQICEEDIAINRRLGANGRDLIPDGARILTHCNAGALATAGYGTALGVIRAAFEEGRKIHVYVDETRPVLQGARLTAWELMREKIPCTLITDSMAGFLMQQGKIDLIIVGADRIAANGDTANKIGTYTLAVLARSHRIPFYIAAPLSTIDPALSDGSAIVIEERNPEEVTWVGGVQTAPEGIAVWNPAFDVTPHTLITAIITEAGVLRPPYAEAINHIWPSGSG
ncbi:MAG: S-methyl-5-thioribose-1-phosphate isomerase [Syntrophus sp. RIFOXYC2_FULL_54_9]|nr:MAG: S-methyl-5-thioribose-1-phosphate isomerase [Syntrophus sp. RIFOXYC2_FULL_54_9]